MTELELIKILQLKREAAIRASKEARLRGDVNEANFQLGMQCAFLGAENLIRRSHQK